MTTDLDPNKTQGRVLHPDQHRVFSERESARAQGFPDTYMFFWLRSANRYRQIGNSVPPPLARELGLMVWEAMVTSDGPLLAGRRETGGSWRRKRRRREDEGGGALKSKNVKTCDVLIDLTLLTDTEGEEDQHSL